MNENTISSNLTRIKDATDDIRSTLGTPGAAIEDVASDVATLSTQYNQMASDYNNLIIENNQLRQQIADITPKGTISITQNGTVNVGPYASANVNVSGGGQTNIYRVETPEEMKALSPNQDDICVVTYHGKVSIEDFEQGTITNQQEVILDAPLTNMFLFGFGEDGSQLNLDAFGTSVSLRYHNETMQEDVDIYYESTDEGITFIANEVANINITTPMIFDIHEDEPGTIDRFLTCLADKFDGIFIYNEGAWEYKTIGASVTAAELFRGKKVYTDNGFVNGTFDVNQYTKYGLFMGAMEPANMPAELLDMMGEHSLYVKRKDWGGNSYGRANYWGLTNNEWKAPTIRDIYTLTEDLADPKYTFQDGKYLILITTKYATKNIEITVINMETEECYRLGLLTKANNQNPSADVDIVNKKMYIGNQIYSYNLETKELILEDTISGISNGVLVYPKRNLLYVYVNYNQYRTYDLLNKTWGPVKTLPVNIHLFMERGMCIKTILDDDNILVGSCYRASSTAIWKINMSTDPITVTQVTTDGIVDSSMTNNSTFAKWGRKACHKQYYDIVNNQTKSMGLAYMGEESLSYLIEYNNKLFAVADKKIKVIKDYIFNYPTFLVDAMIILGEGRSVVVDGIGYLTLKDIYIPWDFSSNSVVEKIYYKNGDQFELIKDHTGGNE